MNENIKLLLDKVSKDEALQAKFKDVKNPDEAYKVATSIQGGYTKDEFIAAMKDLRSKASKDLSDDDLEKAAGGDLAQDIQSITSVTMLVTKAFE